MSRTIPRPPSTRALLIFALVCLALAPAANSRGLQADNKTASTQPSSTDVHPVLIELFTSEGCSSCPPADLFLQKLDAAQPIPGAQLIVLSEHVTAWDQDGWKDPNSLSSLTDRQISYVSAHRLPPPATPQLIVDGAQELRLGDAQQIKALLQKAAATPKVPVRIGEVTMDAANPSLLRAHIETDINSEKHGGDVFVAIALDHVESQVLKGENGGKHLVHVAVVQQITKVGKLPKGKNFSQDVQLKLAPGTDPRNVRMVAFVQESGPGDVLGAAQRKPAI